MRHRILEALDDEWRRASRSPEASRAVARWAEQHPALAGAEDLEDLLGARNDRHHAGPLLGALAALAPHDQLAARTLLQAMLPGVVGLASSLRGADVSALDEMVALAWLRIRTYPSTRRGSVAGNILYDVRKAYVTQGGREALFDEGVLEASVPDPEPGPDTVASYRWLLGELAAAERAGVVSRATLRAIVRTRVAGEPVEEVAADERMAVTHLHQRRWRAERRIRARLTGVRPRRSRLAG